MINTSLLAGGTSDEEILEKLLALNLERSGDKSTL